MSGVTLREVSARDQQPSGEGLASHGASTASIETAQIADEAPVTPAERENAHDRC